METKSTIVKDYLINIYGILCVLFAIFIAVARVINTLATFVLILCLSLLSLANKNSKRQDQVNINKPRRVTNKEVHVAVNLTNIHRNIDLDHHIHFREHYNLINYSDEVKI